ncbi:MAG: tyrosine-type recombinase/integrase family protein [Selenomonadaceae bacterium]|nr:tyrosine-type recombinase/integrase family protein [Selenomonadaceae bacterium]
MTAWLNEVVASNVKVSSIQHYKSYVKNHIYPQIGEVKVQELTPAILDKWIRDMQKANYSYNTISNIHSFLHQALDYAVYPAQLINANPATYIKVPKNAPRNVIKRAIIMPERFKSLLEKYPFGTPYYIPLLLLYHTGMRLGDSYVYIYCEPNGHIQRQSKALPANGEKVSLLCVYSNGQLVLRGKITEINPNLTFKTYVHDTVQEQIVKLQEETAANFDKILQTKS